MPISSSVDTTLNSAIPSSTTPLRKALPFVPRSMSGSKPSTLRMKARRQRMQMRERIQRGADHPVLGPAREREVVSFIEQRAAKANQRVAGEYCHAEKGDRAALMPVQNGKGARCSALRMHGRVPDAPAVPTPWERKTTAKVLARSTCKIRSATQMQR